MKKILTQVAVLTLSISLVACSSSNTQSTNTGIGAATGAVVGGLAGSLVGGGTGKVVAVGVGAIAGALIGGSIGHSMDSSDTTNVNTTMSKNASNQPTTWTNSKTGAKYTVTPGKAVSVDGYSNCRQFRTTAIMNGKKQHIHGVACQQSDGSWVAVRQ